MPKKQSTASKKARAAARTGQKFTTALREGAAPDADPREREIPMGGRGGEIWHEDMIRNGLWDREGSWGRPEAVLADRENWHYGQVELDWMEHASEQLASHGIHWEPESETAIVPGRMTEAEVERLLDEVRSGFDAWIEGVTEETRRGKPEDVENGVRGEEEPGGLWIVAVDRVAGD